MKDDTKMIAAIAAELKLPLKQVQAAVELLNAGNTIPFIARYRKEATGRLDEIALRSIEDALEKAKTLAARKNTIIKSLTDQGLLTDALATEVQDCTDIKTLEAIYLPYKPKRRTRATIARERGLQPLADFLLAQETSDISRQARLKEFVNKDKEVPDTKSALQGALDIVAEKWSEDAQTRQWLADQAMKFGKLACKIKRGKKKAEGAEKFEQYFDRQESVSRVPGHRVLAMLRGASEGILRVELELEGNREASELKQKLITNRQFEFSRDLADCVDDCYERLLLPATDSAVLSHLKEKADEEAIEVFGKNLHELLMSAPAGPRAVSYTHLTLPTKA